MPAVVLAARLHAPGGQFVSASPAKHYPSRPIAAYCSSKKSSNSSFCFRNAVSKWLKGNELRSTTRQVVAERQFRSIVALHDAADNVPSSSSRIRELPCLPFPPNEVFVPGSRKTLYLYEARFLAMLDEVLASPSSQFLHITVATVSSLVVDLGLEDSIEAGEVGLGISPGFDDDYDDEEAEGDEDDVGEGGVSDGADDDLDEMELDDADLHNPFVVQHSCLATVEKVQKQSVGALVTIRGDRRVLLQGFSEMDPYLKGLCTERIEPRPDDLSALVDATERVLSLLEDMRKLSSQVAPGSPWGATVARALEWVEEAEDVVADRYAMGSRLVGGEGGDALEWSAEAAAEAAARCDPEQMQGDVILERAMRLSFAALQESSDQSQEEIQELMRVRLSAMEKDDTLERLGIVQQYLEDRKGMLAAKLALKKLNMT
eukprot:jgi/Mesvir1/23887/Mv10676-RA.1